MSGEALREAVAQHPDPLVLGRHLQLRDPERLAHADDLVRGQRAGAHAALVAAAVHLGLDAHARLAPHEERAHALRAVGLVRRERHQVDLERAEVERDLAGGLRRVDVEDDAARAADLADRRDVLHDADFVVDGHHRHDDRVRPQRLLERREVEQAVRQHVEIGDREALALQLAHRVERGLVLGAHGDEVLALVLVEVRGALQREVDRFRRARGPDDLARIAVHQRRDVLARLLHRLLGGPAERVRARRGIAEVLGEVRDHLLRDARVDRRRRRVVEVDRGLHCSVSIRWHVESGRSGHDGRARARAAARPAAAGPAAP